jgi:hypothetical protein
MQIPTRRIGLITILPLLVVLFTGWPAHSGKTGVVEIYKKATAPVNDEARVEATLEVPAAAVIAQSKYQGGMFRVETRKDKMERYQCSQCHNNKAVKAARAAELAHGDIVLVHGGKQKPLNCFTCHKQDERDYLVAEKGSRIDMDHSYQMCGQCHFRQKKDWVGGAHGKRVSNWAGTRVVKNCTACHDPHAPLFEKRWPKTYSMPLSK